MAPVKKPRPSSSSSASRSKSGRPGGTSAIKSNNKQRDKTAKRLLPAKQVKTKPSSPATLTNAIKKKKKKVYTESQLNLPLLNGVVPASSSSTVVHHPSSLNSATRKKGGAGKVKNKVYVDDAETMLTILNMVSAEREGDIESRVLRARKMEEIRAAKKDEAERRREGRNQKIEEVKEQLRHKKRNKRRGGEEEEIRDGSTDEKKKKKRKSVSFASR